MHVYHVQSLYRQVLFFVVISYLYICFCASLSISRSMWNLWFNCFCFMICQSLSISRFLIPHHTSICLIFTRCICVSLSLCMHWLVFFSCHLIFKNISYQVFNTYKLSVPYIEKTTWLIFDSQRFYTSYLFVSQEYACKINQLQADGFLFGTVTMHSLHEDVHRNSAFELTHYWVQIDMVYIDKDGKVHGLAKVKLIPLDATCMSVTDITPEKWDSVKWIWILIQPLFTSSDIAKGNHRSSLMVNGIFDSDITIGICNNYTCQMEKCVATRNLAVAYKRTKKGTRYICYYTICVQHSSFLFLVFILFPIFQWLQYLSWICVLILCSLCFHTTYH